MFFIMLTLSMIKNESVDILIHKSFIGFEVMEGQAGSEMEQRLYNTLKINKIDLKKLKEIGFDGVVNMSGIYNGLQKCIKKI